VVTGVTNALHPPSNVEVIDPTTLHLGGEFAESNLGTAVEPDGSVTVRLIAEQYNFVSECVRVPDTPVKFRLTSADAIHGLLIVGTNVNTMVVPGYVAEIAGDGVPSNLTVLPAGFSKRGRLAALVPALLVRRRVVLSSYLGEIDRWLRKRHAKLFHRIGDNPRYRQIAKPFVIGRDHIPRRVTRAGRREGILERLHIIVPKRALGIVRFANFPIARWIVKPLRESRELLLLADM
jgi:hypothetical protein